MSRRMLLAAAITALGALITLVNLRDGLAFSFPLVLGVLLLVDGALRFSMLARDAGRDEPRADRAAPAAATPAVPPPGESPPLYGRAGPSPRSTADEDRSEVRDAGPPPSVPSAPPAVPERVPQRDEAADHTVPDAGDHLRDGEMPPRAG